MKILVADDEKNTRHALCDLLRSSGYEVVPAADGRSAIDAVRASEFDLLITDLVMPGADGMEVIKAARKRRRETLAIVITAFSQEFERRISEDPIVSEGTLLLSKPFRIHALVLAMSKLGVNAAAAEKAA